VSLLKNLKRRTQRRIYRVRKSQASSRGRKLRIAVFRSLKHIYAQIINDADHKTILSYSSLNVKNKSGDKKAVAKNVGMELGKLALQNKVTDVFFDRGKFLYLGRVRALAEGLREAGLKF